MLFKIARSLQIQITNTNTIAVEPAQKANFCLVSTETKSYPPVKILCYQINFDL